VNDRSTRERLLDAARYLFWERGYTATGMAEILHRAQANAGSFYHFFPSKEALLLVSYSLAKLNLHITASRRLLNNLRTLRRLLLAERGLPAEPEKGVAAGEGE